MKKKSFLLIVCIVVIWGCQKKNPGTDAAGQSAQRSWRVFNKLNSPLPDNQVNALATDGKALWIGTNNGLARFDGRQWTVFTTSDSTIPDPRVQALSVEENGTVWVGTAKGLARYDGQEWRSFNSGNSPLSNDKIMCLTWDAVNRCTWVGAQDQLFSVDTKEDWHQIDFFDDIIYAMACSKDGTLWLGSFNHFAFRGRIKKYKNNQWANCNLDEQGYPSTFPYALIPGSDDTMLGLLSGTSTSGIVGIRPGMQIDTKLAPGPDALRAVATTGSTIWAAGSSLYQLDNGITTNIKFPVPYAGALIMAADREQNIWIGTFNDGLLLYTCEE